MGNMVETVAIETKKRILYEQSLRPIFVEIEVQTACEMADMETVCALDEEISENEVVMPLHEFVCTCIYEYLSIHMVYT